MAKRYYRVAYLDQRAGWVEVPQGFDTEKEAIDFSKELAEEKRCPTRVKRAPKGWEP